ncbi:cation:proton antiporter [Candidatus Micrarchaeota archaeon]|nr:cation:proton antiporter [Candidatus Micrarchaeota archaeon]
MLSFNETLGFPFFFVSLLLLMVFAFFFGVLFRRMGLPSVFGEIFGGLILGSSLFRQFFPDFFKTSFLPATDFLFLFYWIGLIFLIFVSGSEIRNNFSKDDHLPVLALVVTSTLLPLIIGWFGLGLVDVSELIGSDTNLDAFRIVVAAAIAITSIPVISKIFFDLGIIKTRFSSIVLSVASVHDILVWVLLAIATQLTNSSTLASDSIYLQFILTILILFVVIFLSTRLNELVRKKPSSDFSPTLTLNFVLIFVLFFVVLTYYLNINLIFGAMLAGVFLGAFSLPVIQNAMMHIREFSFAFFVPIYFALVGLKIDLIASLDFSLFVYFLLASSLIQGVSVLLTSRILGFSWLSSFNLSVALNARGALGIVVATIAFESGIISEKFFVAIVLSALVTVLFAGWWLKYVLSTGKNLLVKEKL